MLGLVKEGSFTVANIGDSTALRLKQTGKILKLTDEQTPNRDDEYNRIVRNNGLVTIKDDIARVDGSIAVSRAIGDLKFKQFLIPEPETHTYQIEQDDDLLILATDGLFMVFNEEQLARMITGMRSEGQSLIQISKKITDECNCNYNCKDNVTVVMVDLKKHYQDFQTKVKKHNQRRYYSQVRHIGGPQVVQPGHPIYSQI